MHSALKAGLTLFAGSLNELVTPVEPAYLGRKACKFMGMLHAARSLTCSGWMQNRPNPGEMGEFFRTGLTY
jgi:hypothetical protein